MITITVCGPPMCRATSIWSNDIHRWSIDFTTDPDRVLAQGVSAHRMIPSRESAQWKAAARC